MSASLPREISTELDLSLIRQADERVAAEAFSRLWATSLPVVLRLLRARGVRPDDAEDVAQSAATDLWKRRLSLRASGPGEWYWLVRTVVGRGLNRHTERQGPCGELLSENLPAEDVPYLDEVVAAAMRGQISHTADELWLGAPQNDDSVVGAAAVRLLLVDGLTPELAARMFGATPDDVFRWMEDPAILARALHSGLCWSNDQLASYVLRPGAPPGAREMGSGSPWHESVGGWSSEEARLVCLRLRNGLSEEELASVTDEPLSVAALVERIRAALPFARLAQGARSRLDAGGSPDALGSIGLWKRIVLDYALRGLPHRQIVERAGPPAAVGGRRVDEGTLANWLSTGRILSQLAARLQGDRE